MDPKEKLTFKFASNKAQCKKCIYATLTPLDSHCAKYRMKPNNVLYEGEECSEFEEDTEQ